MLLLLLLDYLPCVASICNFLRVYYMMCPFRFRNLIIQTMLEDYKLQKPHIIYGLDGQGDGARVPIG
jgi:hypothetical protein